MKVELCGLEGTKHGIHLGSVTHLFADTAGRRLLLCAPKLIRGGQSEVVAQNSLAATVKCGRGSISSPIAASIPNRGFIAERPMTGLLSSR